jgi:hypothetical protein
LPEALSAAVADIKEVVHLNDALPEEKLFNELPEMSDELVLPDFIIPEGAISRHCSV